MCVQPQELARSLSLSAYVCALVSVSTRARVCVCVPPARDWREALALYTEAIDVCSGITMALPFVLALVCVLQLCPVNHDDRAVYFNNRAACYHALVRHRFIPSGVPVFMLALVVCVFGNAVTGGV